MQLEEIYKAIRLSLQDRLSGPAIPSFCISWSLINYKFFVILFSQNPVSKTFELITSICFPSPQAVAVYGVLAPAAAAATYIFVWPYPEKYIYSFWRRRQKDILELRRQIEEETPISMEEARALREGFRERLQSVTSELHEKSTEVSDLRSQLAKLSKQGQDIPSGAIQPSKKGKDGVTPDGSEILKLFVERDGAHSYGLIAESVKLNSVRLRHALDELVDYGMLATYEDSDGREFFTLAPSGRKYLVTNGYA